MQINFNEMSGRGFLSSRPMGGYMNIQGNAGDLQGVQWVFFSVDAH